MTLESALLDDYVPKAMSGEIVVMSDRKWFGDPRGSPQYGSGMYAVFLDGRKAAVLQPRGQVVLSCDGGAHRVQVRQGAGRSPTLEVQVAEGETVFLRADMADRDRSFLYRMGTYLFHAGRFLALRVVSSSESSRDASE